jgi:hypothetical protein
VSIDKNSYYLPYHSDIERYNSDFDEVRKFMYIEGKATVTDWSKLIVDTYKFEHNGKIGIAFLVASLFRDILFKKLGRFPLLYNFGIPKSGKSAFRDSFMQPFGIPQTTPSLESASTPKSFSRKLSQARNSLVVFEEYKNNIDPARIGMLKGIYDGIGYDRSTSTNDNKTKTPPVLSALMFCGQELLTKETALFSRCFVVSFFKKRYNFSEVEVRNELQRIENEGLGQVLTRILGERKLIEKHFNRVFNNVVQELMNDILRDKNIDQRSIESLAILITPIKILGEVLDFGFHYSQLAMLLCDRMIEQTKVMESMNEVNTFFSIVEHLIDKKRLLDNDEYSIKEIGDKQEWHLCFPDIYPKYCLECKSSNIVPLEKATLKDYLQKDKDGFIEYSQKRIREDQKKKWYLIYHFKNEI